MAKITKIAATKDGTTEIYYEPSAPRQALASLRRSGWRVASTRIDAEAEAVRLEAHARRILRDDPSPLSHGRVAGLRAGQCREQANAARAAAQGVGSLTS